MLDKESKIGKTKLVGPEREDYRAFIMNEWNDIHHSRMQEWSALGVIAGAHIGIISLLQSITNVNSKLLILTTLISIFFCVLGILLTLRHRHLMIVKFRWIYDAEYKLGLIKVKGNDEGVIPEENLDIKENKTWKGLALPRLLSTSGLMFLLYVAFIFIDVLIFLYFDSTM